jgi:hypothetical protein
MAQDNQPSTVSGVAAPQHYVPPTTREMRAQAVHRLQIGLFGLAAMVLLVGLANIIMNRVRMSEAGVASGTAAAVDTPKVGSANDPLAEIGVAPSANSSATSVAGNPAR